jgi:hypothetical protein
MPEMTVPGGLKTVAERRILLRPAAFAERAFPQIGGELGVPLPAQRALAPFHGMMAGLAVGRGDAEAPRQFGKHRLVDAGAALRHEGKLHQDARLFDQRMRPRMHLAQRTGPALMRGKPMTLPLERGWNSRLDGSSDTAMAPYVPGIFCVPLGK